MYILELKMLFYHFLKPMVDIDLCMVTATGEGACKETQINSVYFKIYLTDCQIERVFVQNLLLVLITEE